MLVPVTLAGGVGSRLWPLSVESYPKQLLQLTGCRSLFQETLSRLGHQLMAAPLVMTNIKYLNYIRQQLSDSKVEDAKIVLEPEAKGTAPAIALAAFIAMENDKDACMMVLPTDHVIDCVDTFYQHILLAYELAQKNQCVTFGVRPSYAATGYGYIHQGEAFDSDKAFNVNQFVEKPDQETADKYLQSGEYLWNSGMFVLKASHYLAELERFVPKIYVASKAAYQQAKRENEVVYIDSKAFSQSPVDSIDYAVLERTDKSAVIPMDLGWHDVGSWDSLYEVLEKDLNGNVVQGDGTVLGCQNSFCFSQSKPVVMLGLDDVMVVETDDAVLVLKRGESQHVGEYVKQMNKLKT